tara:strand:+ start:1943 stop:2911 length:969 start_codon:yes stop_codon:yes gene_type:complete
MGLFSKLFNRIKKRKPGGFVGGRMGAGMLPRFRKRMGMMGGLAGLRDRMRPARNMMFGGRRQLNPFLGMNNLPRKNRFLPPLSELPPQPGGNRKFLDMIGGGASSDIMPKDPGFGVNLPKPRPIMPGVMPQPSGPTGPIRNVIEPVEGTIEPPKEDFSGYLSFYDNPPVPGMAGGGEADSSEFPDLSGDGKITKKDILMGRGVIKMNMGGDPADEQDRALMSEADRNFLASVDNDADFRNAQNALMNYRNFYASQPTGFQQFLPSPDQLMENPEALMNVMQSPDMRAMLGEDGRMITNDIDMMLQDLASPEKKSLNPPMMFR